jgi:predicted RNA-binding protein YlqC (UPF0109 family)
MAENSGDVRALIEHVAKALVSAPEEVMVELVDEPEEVVVELTVAEPDMGRVIGKQGRTARAMRHLLSAASSKLQKHHELEILE